MNNSGFTVVGINKEKYGFCKRCTQENSFETLSQKLAINALVCYHCYKSIKRAHTHIQSQVTELQDFYLHNDLLACVRPSSTQCMCPDFSHNEGMVFAIMNLLF